MHSYFILVCFALITINQALSTDQINSFQQEALAQHNILRKKECAGPLQQNSQLDKEAQEYCEQMASSGNFTHSGRVNYGETSYQKIPSESSDNGATPVNHWYQEKVNYTVNNPGAALHYTQLVWKASTMFGFGVCTVGNNGIMFVALYSPRGNYENQFAQNVGCSK